MKAARLLGSVATLAQLFLIATSPAAPAKTLSIEIPQDVEHRDVTILARYGDNYPKVGEIEFKEGKYAGKLELTDSATSVKLIAHYPGAKVVTAEYTIDDIAMSEPFSPVFEPLPTVPLTIRFVDTEGNPITRQPVTLKQNLHAREYLGDKHGIMGWPTIFPTFDPPPGTGRTNADGEIECRVPSLLDDPYYTKRKMEDPGFRATIMRPADSPEFGWFSTPDVIPAQRKYEKPVTVTMTYYGNVKVALSESFLDDLDIPVWQRRGMKIQLTSPGKPGADGMLPHERIGNVKPFV